MRARDVMTAHPSVVTPDDTIQKAAQLMRDRNIGVLPVIDNLQERHLRGMLTDRDIVLRCVAAGHGPMCLVRDHMTAHHLTSVRMDDEIALVASRMKRDRIRRLPVMAEGDRLAGVVALADIANRMRPSDAVLIEDIERATTSTEPLAH